MKKYIIQLFLLLFLIILIGNNLKAQTKSFTYNYVTKGDDIVKDLIQAENGDIYLAGFQANNKYRHSQAKGLIIKLDKNCNYISSETYEVADKSLLLYGIIELEDGSFVVSGVITDTVEVKNPKIHLMIIDSSLKVLNDRTWDYFPVGSKFNGMATRLGFDNDILITGCTIIDNWRMYGCRFNSSLDSLSFEIFTDFPNMGVGGSMIKQIEDNKYWLCEGVGGYYYTTDTLFNIITRIKSPRRIDAPYGIKWDSDTSFYITGEWNDATDNDIAMFYQSPYTDTSAINFNWWGDASTLELTAREAMDFQNKDSIFISGTSPFIPGYYWTSSNWCFVLQTDSMLNIRWESFIGGDANYQMMKIITTNDGGCLLASFVNDYQNPSDNLLDIRIIKLDKDGNLVSVPEKPLLQITEAIVYPNPGTEYLKVRVAAQHSHSVFELYSLDGKLMIRKDISGKHATIDASKLISGTYIYKVYNSSGLDESGKWVKQ